MGAAKLAITIDEELVKRLDRLVAQRRFPSRSRAISLALKAQLDRLDRGRLARECAKLNAEGEQRLAEGGASYDLETWPEH